MKLLVVRESGLCSEEVRIEIIVCGKIVHEMAEGDINR